MPKLVSIHWKEFERFLLFSGCEFQRQKGDHRVYWRTGLNRPIILPTYKNLPTFIIRNNLRTLGTSVDQYLQILKKI